MSSKNDNIYNYYSWKFRKHFAQCGFYHDIDISVEQCALYCIVSACGRDDSLIVNVLSISCQSTKRMLWNVSLKISFYDNISEQNIENEKNGNCFDRSNSSE